MTTITNQIKHLCTVCNVPTSQVVRVMDTNYPVGDYSSVQTTREILLKGAVTATLADCSINDLTETLRADLAKRMDMTDSQLDLCGDICHFLTEAYPLSLDSLVDLKRSYNLAPKTVEQIKGLIYNLAYNLGCDPENIALVASELQTFATIDRSGLIERLLEAIDH